MNIRNIKLSVASICLIAGAGMAQDNPSEGLETTTSKTYKINMGDTMEKRTVEVSTMRSTEVMTKDDQKENIDQDRNLDYKPMITKTVKIDNDKDDSFDEKIVFTYSSNTPEDFVLVSEDEELMVAIDNGEDLKIVKDMSLKSKNTSENKSTYIFTDKDGKDIEFLVEEHSTMSNQKS